MFHKLKLSRKFAMAFANLEKVTRIHGGLSGTASEADLRENFMMICKTREFSDEANNAMLLNMYLLRICQAAFELREHKTYSLEVSSRLMGVDALMKMIQQWEMIAPDRVHYDEHIGVRLKSEFNATWKQLLTQSRRIAPDG